MIHRLLVAVLLIWPFAVAAQDTSEADKGYLTRLLEDNLSGDDRTVIISGFAGAFSSEATITQITISDVDGVWLTLDNVALIWNRSALLRGQIDVEKLAAEKITLSRLPAAQSDAPTPEAVPFALPELPVGLALDTLDIARIDLGETILGQPLSFSLTGNAALASGELDAQIVADRLDAKPGVFDIKANYANADRVLALDLTIAEAPGGLAATLLDLPGAPSVELTLTGDAPLDAFSAELAIATDGAPRIAGTFGLASIDDGTGFSVDIQGDVTTLFLPEYKDFFGPDVALSASGAALAAGGFQLSTLDVAAQSIRLNGSATIAASGLPQQISLSGQVSDPAGDIVLLPLTGPKTYVDRMDLNIGFDRALSDDWTTDINIAGFDRPGLLIRDLSLSGGGVIRDANGSAVTAQLQYQAAGITLDDAAMAKALGDTISGDIDVDWQSGQPTRISRLALDGAGLALLADATIDGIESGLATKISVLLDTADIARFSDLAGQPLVGAANVVVIGDIAPLNGTFDAILTGTTNDLAVSIDQLDPYLRGDGTLSLHAVRDGAGTRVEDLRLQTAMADISGKADLTSNGSRADLSVNLTDIAPVVAGLQGAAALDVDVAQDANGQIVFDVSGDLPKTQFSANGTVDPTGDTQTIALSSAARISDLTVYQTISGQDLAGAANLTIDGVVLGDGQSFDMNISGNTQDLRTGIARLDPLLRGAGEISAEVARVSQDRFEVRGLTVTTPEVALDLDGAGGLRGAADLQGQLTLTNAAVLDPALIGPLSLAIVATRDDQDRANVQLDATATGTTLAVRADIASPQDGYTIDGTINADVADLARYRGLAGRPIGGAVSVTASGTLAPDLRDFDVVLDATTRNAVTGISQVDTLLRGAGDIAVTARQVDGALSVPRFAVTYDNIAATGALDGKDATGQGRFNARLRDIGLFTDAISGAVTAQGTVQRGSNDWGVNATLTGPGGIAARANGRYSDAGRANIDVTGNAPLALANDLIEPRRATGDVRFDMAVNGPVALSSVTGEVALANAQIDAPNLGQSLRDISGTIRLLAGRAQVAIQGALDSGGQININGPVNLSAPYQGDVTARLSALRLQDPTLYETTVDGTINLSGPLAGGARIDGALTLGRTELQVPSSGIGALGDLPDVTHIGASSGVTRTLQRAGAVAQNTVSSGASGPAYPLNLTINAPSQIFIRGRGLDAELGGTLTLGGTTQNIIPLGQFSLVRGRLDILQQRFELTEGSATLQGDFVPFLRLVAATDTPTGTLVRIIVEGPATAPEVSFESVPDLPQDEVLAQLIFGRNLSEISPLQAVQLAAAVGTLAGRGGGGLIDTFRQDIGLDDFDVTTDADGNAAVRAGKYLSENVYTDLTVNSEGETNITINLDVTDNVTAKGTLDTDGETSIGIFYERDY